MKLSNNGTFNFDFGNEALVFLKFTNTENPECPAGASLSHPVLGFNPF